MKYNDKYTISSVTYYRIDLNKYIYKPPCDEYFIIDFPNIYQRKITWLDLGYIHSTYTTEEFEMLKLELL